MYIERLGMGSGNIEKLGMGPGNIEKLGMGPGNIKKSWEEGYSPLTIDLGDGCRS